MYTNIDTDHSIDTMKAWFCLHRGQLPIGFPSQMILEATEIIMKSNVFQFDNTYWLQKIGTAMGTNMACLLATIYYSYHEETNLLPTYQHQPLVPNQPPALLLYARLIDDSVQVWDTAYMPPNMKQNLKKHISEAMSFGQLEWEVEEPSRQVNFLDLTITLEPNGNITTKTYVKPINLHLYIDPSSSHSKGILKSLVYGTIMRYWKQNTYLRDFIHITQQFYRHLLNRGYPSETLTPLFQEAGATITVRNQGLDCGTAPPTSPNTQSRNRLFLHWEYHPRDISRKAIRQCYNETLAPALAASPLDIRQLTIAYSNQRSLRSILNKTQLDEAPNERASIYVDSLKHPPANL
jgi:hypothetical protein